MGVGIRGVDIRMERVRQAGVKGNGEREGEGEMERESQKEEIHNQLHSASADNEPRRGEPGGPGGGEDGHD